MLENLLIVGIALVAVIAVIILLWVAFNVGDEHEAQREFRYDDDDSFISDIQDAVREDTPLDPIAGEQLPLWPTGQMPKVRESGTAIVPSAIPPRVATVTDAPVIGGGESTTSTATVSSVSSTAGTPSAPAGATTTTAESTSSTATGASSAVTPGSLPALPPSSLAPTPAVPAGATPATNWWETTDPGTLVAVAGHLAAIHAIATSVPVPSVEEETPAAPEAVSVAPGAVREVPEPEWPLPPAGTKWSDYSVTGFAFDPQSVLPAAPEGTEWAQVVAPADDPTPVESTQQWTARMTDEASLWWTQQEIERAKWRAEVGLSDEKEAA